MVEILNNYDLTKLNTFGIQAKARYFIEIKNEEDLKELFQTKEFQENEKLFLGAGSNVLFTQDFSGIVVLNRLKGIEVLEEDENQVLVRAMGGEIWHDLVLFAVDNGYWGIENLSLIPGTVGATPVQNIGAYGVEIKDNTVSVEAYNIENGEKKVFSNQECEFGYRDSVFKQALKGKYFISAIILKLDKKQNQKLSYKILQDYIEKNNLEIKNSKDVADIVAEIRQSKLPNPKILGNAGSFFKNVYVEGKKFNELKNQYPEIPSFQEDNLIKIPTGWLIEQCGWKGLRVGNVGMHERQALVLVNYGGATGEEIKNLAEKIIDSVYEKFDLKITPEVNLI